MINLFTDEAKPNTSFAKSKYKTITKDRQSLTQKIKNMKSKHKQLQTNLKKANDLRTNSKFNKALTNIPTDAAAFIRCQLREAPKKQKGRRFTVEEKIFCLTLYKQGPKAYRYYSKIFALPCSKTISNLLKQLPLQVGK